MNCEEFMDLLDRKMDGGDTPAKENLPENMVRHMEECGKCAGYYEEMGAVHRLLMKMDRESVSDELRESLIGMARSTGRESAKGMIPAIVPKVLKLSVPAVFVWLAVMFIAPNLVPLVETLLLLVGLTPMFERIGRRMITDRV